MKRLLWWKWIGLGALCAVIGVAGAAEYLNFTDFCYGNWRYLSDAELIDAAIAHEISHVPAIRSQNAVTYASVAHQNEIPVRTKHKIQPRYPTRSHG